VVITVLAGSTWGYADGTGQSAQFRIPYGVAVDGAGNVYVADYANSRIRKISPGGLVSTLAGSTEGYADGTGAAAMFNRPSGVAVDGAGNVYVADLLNYSIRKISPGGQVSTLAGNGTSSGWADGNGAIWYLSSNCIAVDSAGNLYIQNGDRILKITQP
jgi:streptogramin lyase